jgi:hypothetical protein
MLKFDASIFGGELPVTALVWLALRSCSQAAISSMRIAQRAAERLSEFEHPSHGVGVETRDGSETPWRVSHLGGWRGSTRQGRFTRQGSVTTTTRRQPGAGVLDAIRRRRKDPFEQVGLGAARPVIH